LDSVPLCKASHRRGNQISLGTLCLILNISTHPLNYCFTDYLYIFYQLSFWLDNDVSSKSKRFLTKFLCNMLRNILSQFFIVKCLQKSLLIRIIIIIIIIHFYKFHYCLNFQIRTVFIILHELFWLVYDCPVSPQHKECQDFYYPSLLVIKLTLIFYDKLNIHFHIHVNTMWSANFTGHKFSVTLRLCTSLEKFFFLDDSKKKKSFWPCCLGPFSKIVIMFLAQVIYDQFITLHAWAIHVSNSTVSWSFVRERYILF